MPFTHKTPIPTDEELQEAHPVNPKPLHPGVALDKPHHLVMKEKLWTSWSSDSFGVKYANGKEPFECDVKGHVATVRDRMIVRDNQTHNVVAVILKMHLRWETTFKIYGLTPYDDAVPQPPSGEQKYEGKDLYEWATCRDKMMSVQKTMTTPDGVSYVMDGIGKVFAAKRQMRLTRNDKVCAHFMESTLGIFAGNQWEIKICPGIDPVLVIAFGAIMDEMNEA